MDKIITIGREYGSGGREIAENLAKILDIPYYDKEIISIAAKESGLNEEIFYQNDEQHGSILYSMVMGNYSMAGSFTGEMPIFQKVFLAQFDAIKKLADKGPCVIVGRCADYVLKDYPNVVSAFITADYDARIKRAIERNKLTEKEAESYIKRTDKKRSSYYNFNTNLKWGTASTYDICLNSTRVGIKDTARLLKAYIEAI